MRWIYIVLSGALLATLPLGANAEFYSGNKLKDYLEKWESSSPGVDGAIGAGYVVGAYDSRVGGNICPPSNASITVGQITAMVLKYMRENPDKLHRSGDFLVALALMKAWPCAPRQQNTSPDASSPAPASQPHKPRPKPKEESSPF